MMSLNEPLVPHLLPPATPTIELGVPGPHRQDGLLLRAAREEALLWDLENEVVSTRRRWIEERHGWWIAVSYLDSVIDIVLRSFPSVLLLHPDGTDRLISRDGVSVVQPRLL